MCPQFEIMASHSKIIEPQPPLDHVEKHIGVRVEVLYSIDSAYHGLEGRVEGRKTYGRRKAMML